MARPCSKGANLDAGCTIDIMIAQPKMPANGNAIL